MCRRAILLVPFLGAALAAQTTTDLRQVLERLDTLEAQNRNLLEEIRALRQEVAASRGETTAETPPLEERVAVQERRIEEQAQAKVEASQRMPVQLTGMLLFNAFHNGGRSGDSQYPVVAGARPKSSNAGASLRQTLIGFKFNGPEIFAGGKVSGTIMMDLFEQSSDSSYQGIRLRTGSINIDWKTRSLMIGQDKPIIAPRDPSSLAQVGVSPLTGAGNLWLWQPQIRFEQRVNFGEQMGARLQVGAYQTSETSANPPAVFASTLERSRPGLEGRFEIWRKFEGGRRIEIAPGFHASDTHVVGVTVPSRAFSIDWLIQPFEKLEFSGAFYREENLANLGTIRQGFTILGPGSAIAIRGAGGWAQLSYVATKRLTFNLFDGQHDDNVHDLRGNGIDKNRNYGANLIYRLAPNVLFSFEGSQVRTRYVSSGTRLNNHYDLALAYLF
ncbi:MAG: hypothetical protein M3Z36_01090 [Acidobacteriota bacterium]|nr:hypothetical protein [Acidobacteriota bacterium]